MSPNLRIAFRFLTAKKRSMLMSLSCIVLGVGLFIVTQAVTSGFEQFFIRTILGSDGAILIQDKIQATQQSIAAGGAASGFQIELKDGVKYVEGIDEPDDLRKILNTFANVTGASDILRGPVDVISSFKTESGRVYGIVLQDHLRVSNLGNQIVQGSLENFQGTPSGALLGKELAERLQVGVGDPIQLQAGTQTRRYKVSAIYQTGVSDIDRVRVYLNMTEARSLLKKVRGVSAIQLQIDRPASAPAFALHLEDVLGYTAEPWQERQKTWLGVFYALRLSTAITVSIFTLIAGLAMFNTLAMIVLEKTKDIAILRSMGYTRRDISRIFIWQAVVVLVIGTAIGCLVGALITFGVSQMPIHIRGIFTTDHFIVAKSPLYYAEAVVTAIVMVLLASLVPSRRAARLEPGDVIRGTAQ